MNATLRNTVTRRNGEETHAFTLVEVMIAAVVLVVGILGLASVITYATRQDEVNAEFTKAIAGARSAIENVKNTSFASILTTWNQDGATQGIAATNAIGDFNVFGLRSLDTARLYTHSPYPNGSNRLNPGAVFIDGTTSSTIYRVKVVVDWQGALHDQHIELQTMVTDD